MCRIGNIISSILGGEFLFLFTTYLFLNKLYPTVHRKYPSLIHLTIFFLNTPSPNKICKDEFELRERYTTTLYHLRNTNSSKYLIRL